MSKKELTTSREVYEFLLTFVPTIKDRESRDTFRAIIVEVENLLPKPAMRVVDEPTNQWRKTK